MAFPISHIQVKVLLYVEGNNDVTALMEYSKLLFENGVLKKILYLPIKRE